MSVIASIIGAIASAGSAVISAAGSVGSAVGGVVDGIASTVGSIATDVSSVLSVAVGKGVGALVDASTSVFSTIDSGITDAISGISSVFGPIASFIDKTTTVVEHLNDEVIKPITDTVLKTYDAVSNLITELHTDLQGGIKGLLQIPDAISGALATIDAQLGRAMQELGLANKEVVSGTLLPGMGTIFSGPLGSIASGVGALGTGKLDLLSQIGQVQLANCIDASVYQSKLESVTSALAANEGFVGEIGKMLMTIFWALPYLAESVRNDITCFAQGVNQKNPVELLGLGSIVRAFYRGILSDASATEEANKLGLSTDRLKVLKEIEAYLPGPSDALDMLYRGVISQDELNSILAKQALSPADVLALQTIFIRPVSARENMQMYARRQAADANFLPASLGSTPPGVVSDLYPPNRLSPDQAKLDWLAHWKVPQLEWWFTAWTRGMRTTEEFQLAAQMENIPFDVIPDLISVFQEPIQLWMIPDMLGSGILSDSDALAYLHYIGMDDKSASIILKYGQSKGKAPAAAQAGDLAAISASVAATMFTDGIIDAATYTEVLAEHGYSADAAALTVQLAQQKAALAARTANTAQVVARVDAGSMTPADAVSALYSEGYTDAEVAAATAKMKAGAVAKLKLPTRAELDSFLAAGVITQDQWTSGYSLLGYTQDWIPVYLAYLEAKHA